MVQGQGAVPFFNEKNRRDGNHDGGRNDILDNEVELDGDNLSLE